VNTTDDRLALDISERPRDLGEAEVGHWARLAIPARLADGEGPAFRGVTLGGSEFAFADDRAGADDREIGARRQFFGGNRRWSRSRSPDRSASAFSAVVARTMAEDMASSS
jgi:hypothetical protein